jgi:hypothetical protein
VDCRLNRLGHVTTAVYLWDDQWITPLMDVDIGAGVWPVDWDGRTAQGERVSAGINTLIVSVDGQLEKHKVVVRG